MMMANVVLAGRGGSGGAAAIAWRRNRSPPFRRTSVRSSLIQPKKLLVFGDHIFVLSPEVPEPDVASFSLAQHVRVGSTDRVADIGTGVGFLAVIAGAAARRVVAVDLTEESVRCARQNVAVNAMTDRVEVRRGDLFGPVGGETFDLVLANPPQMPTPPAFARQDWQGIADSGGAAGRTMLDRLMTSAADHLERGGRLCFAQYNFLSLDETVALLRSAGFAEVGVQDSDVPIGRLTWERLPYIDTIKTWPEAVRSAPYVHKLHVVTATKG